MNVTPITTKSFLSFFPQTIFQTFYDPDSRGKPAPAFLEYNESEFKKLNKENNGIYFSVNGFDGRRIKEKLAILNAVFGDLDTSKNEDETPEKERESRKRSLWKVLIDEPYPPNLIIVTKNGLQPIWLLKDALVTEAETAVEVCDGIRVWSTSHGALGDKVKDVCRVLRLPGYYHCKSPENPYLIKAFLLHEERIGLLNLKQEYPFVSEEKQYQENKEVYKELPSLVSVSLREVVVKALQEWGEPSVTFDSRGRIVTDRTTAAYIGNGGTGDFIATSGKIPSGNKITFVRKLFNLPDNKEAYRWIKERFNLLDIKKKIIVNSIQSITEKKSTMASNEKFYTGLRILDRKVGGFRSENTYLIGGIEKSGKSSLASTFVVKFLQDGIPCAYINSELPDDEFFQRMASNETRIPFNSIQEKDVDGWKEKYKNLLQYVGVNEISTDGQLDINKAIAHAEFMSNKSKIIVFDNATSFSFSEEKKPAWEILGKAFSRIITLTRIRKVCSFLVCHSKQDASYVETPQNMSKILKSGNYSKVFEDSNTFVRKPQMADILGGTAAKIGLGGAMLIWRPFQKISHEDAGVVSSLVFESFRHSKANGAVLIDFNGETFSFSEKFFQSPEVAFSQKKVEPKREEVNFNENF